MIHPTTSGPAEEPRNMELANFIHTRTVAMLEQRLPARYARILVETIEDRIRAGQELVANPLRE
jgi:hypothetical protein